MMKTNTITATPAKLVRSLTFALSMICAGSAGGLTAQTPCPGVATSATGLLAPAKIILTPRGNFIIAEGGPQVPNNGRVSIVDRHGNRRTLLDGLPSARTFVGDFNGTTGVWLDGRTLYVLNGQGDVTLAGPVPATEKANPAPSSPIFSSVLAVHFSAAMEDSTTGVRLKLKDHESLKAGERLIRSDSRGRRMEIEWIANFPDYARNYPVHSLALQADGKLVIGREFDNGRLTRVNTDGSADTDFNTRANASAGGAFYPFLITSLIALPDGKLLARTGTLRRLNADGICDRTFASALSVTALARQPDGKIIAGYNDGSSARPRHRGIEWRSRPFLAGECGGLPLAGDARPRAARIVVGGDSTHGHEWRTDFRHRSGHAAAPVFPAQVPVQLIRCEGNWNLHAPYAQRSGGEVECGFKLSSPPARSGITCLP